MEKQVSLKQDIDAGAIYIEVAEGKIDHCKKVEAILDVTADGQVVGIELIGVRHKGDGVYLDQ